MKPIALDLTIRKGQPFVQTVYALGEGVKSFQIKNLDARSPQVVIQVPGHGLSHEWICRFIGAEESLGIKESFSYVEGRKVVPADSDTLVIEDHHISRDQLGNEVLKWQENLGWIKYREKIDLSGKSFKMSVRLSLNREVENVLEFDSNTELLQVSPNGQLSIVFPQSLVDSLKFQRAVYEIREDNAAQELYFQGFVSVLSV